MKTIFKYGLDLTDKQKIQLPAGAIILSTMMQYGQLRLWCEVESETTRTEEREIMIVGTGNPINSTAYKYIGSVIDGSFVWHVFEVF
jgi:hypothetical protein